MPEWRAPGDLLLFALEASRPLGEAVAHALDITLSPHEERRFEDGEHKSRPLANVRDRDVYVLQSLHGLGGQSVDDKLVRLLFFVGALRTNGAARVTVLAPYLCYSRKDRRTQANDPVTSRYLATLMEAAGTDRVVTLEAHNVAAYQNAFRCASEHLEARHLLAAPVAEAAGSDDLVVLSPDLGGIKRAEAFRELLMQHVQRPIGAGFMEKYRSRGVVTGERLVGDVDGRTVVIVDDLIAGGTTLRRAAEACMRAGARRILAAAAHGVFGAAAPENLLAPAIERIYISDSVPPELAPAPLRPRLAVVSCAALLADAVRRLHLGEPLPGDIGHPL
ncbi:MAG: ribose-phosphate diphosphokinase [Thiohalomonadaceae bacterium]